MCAAIPTAAVGRPRLASQARLTTEYWLALRVVVRTVRHREIDGVDIEYSLERLG